ncbi:hypothetical protein SAMN05421773_109230 [Streptomyces aidingensis]|uniref:Uncharacterized protein n=1 Tax=Streptomyces aidingensis TaxID=910347 RepID=A0A1I1PJI5_9ACTN|nr:hypothetical protein SAMN05421773_1075 [Streptomyces aidingensis]SFD09984.1 hypothetical protein SAMN05421773_109230 [Streptomyces aidingensis]
MDGDPAPRDDRRRSRLRLLLVAGSFLANAGRLLLDLFRQPPL